MHCHCTATVAALSLHCYVCKNVCTWLRHSVLQCHDCQNHRYNPTSRKKLNIVINRSVILDPTKASTESLILIKAETHVMHII